MNFNEVIQNLKDGKLDFDCHRMELTQCKDEGIFFSGKGYIRQSEEGVLIFKIYVSEIVNTDQYEFLQSCFSFKTGKVYSKDEFYKLSAVTQDGTIWTGKHILPDCSWSMDGNVIVTGTLACLSIETASEQSQEYERIHFFDELEVPLNLMSKIVFNGTEQLKSNRAKFDALGSEFEIRKHPDELVVEVHSDVSLPPYFYLRIQEALIYLVAKPVAWRARIEKRGKYVRLEIASSSPKSRGTKLNPPITRATINFLEYGWKLFALYLNYVVRASLGTYWSPCTYHIHNACEASANSLDAWAVGICVAVEGIANLIPDSSDVAQRQRLHTFQKSLRAFISNKPEFSEFSPRMDGLIGTLGTERVKDKLLRLALSGHVDTKYIKSWTKLRNRQVHPKMNNLKNIATVDVQELFDLIQQTEVLMWQITFHLIGYSGRFSDFGAGGFPSKNYPLEISS